MSNHKSKGKVRYSEYPLQWSDWTWNDKHQCDYRYRETAEGQFDYDYDKASYDRKHASKHVPRTPIAFSTIPGASQQDPEYPVVVSDSYTHGSVDTITRAVAGINLSVYEQGDLHIKSENKNTQHEEFDPHYKVHPQNEFTWGKVFKVLWSEPKGSGGGSQKTTWSFRKEKHGEPIFAKVRRFVIINPMRGHCLCLPIVSYGKQGTTKKGVHAEHHAIIHTEGAVELPKEKSNGMRFSPIKVQPARKEHKLTEWSRLNYAKVYTVEYNVKVWFIGKINPESEARLVADYNVIHPALQNPSLAPATAMSSHHFVKHSQGASASSYSNTDSSQNPTTSYGDTAMSPRYYQQEANYSDAAITPYSEVQTSNYPAASQYGTEYDQG